MKHEKTLKMLILSAVFAALIAVSAFIRIPLPPVAFTMQGMVAILSGLLLGKKYGTFSVGIYIIAGLLGLPVFSQGGGIWYLLNPTFGYIIGFLAAAFIAGSIVNKAKEPSYLRLIAAAITATASVYIVGVLYFCLIKILYLKETLDFSYILIYCVAVFVPKDVAGCIIAALATKKIKKHI